MVDFIVPSNYEWSKKGIKCTLNILYKRRKVSLFLEISKNKIVNYHIKKGTFKCNAINLIQNGYMFYFMNNINVIHKDTLLLSFCKNCIF